MPHSRTLIIAMTLFTGSALLPCLGYTDSDLTLQWGTSMGGISTGTEGTLPTGWRPLTFPKVPRHTQYTVVKEDGATVVRAESHQAASGLTHPVLIDLTEYPMIQWRWKIMNLIEKGNVHRKDGDDYPARIYITFEYDPKKVSFTKKAKFLAGRLLWGDIPIAAINYIWEGRAVTGTIVDNAYTDFVRMIVVESGPEKVGQWVKEERNLYEDYKKAFSEEPSRINGVAIMTDTDNTGEEAVAYYGEIVFKKK